MIDFKAVANSYSTRFCNTTCTLDGYGPSRFFQHSSHSGTHNLAQVLEVELYRMVLFFLILSCTE